jgi:molecular chaperone GrpE
MEEEEKKTEEACDDGVCRTPQEPADPEKKVEEAVKQSLRALADYQNLQKEVAKERAEMGQYATLRVVERFLPIFDNFNTAMSHLPKSDDKAVVNWAVGVGFIQKQVEEALRSLGLTAIRTAGEKFDPLKHEAVGEEESDQEHGTILKEVQAGYEIQGKTVRPSKVILAK